MSTGYLSCHGYQYSSFFGNHGNHGKSVPIVHPWNCLEAVRQCKKNTLSVYPDVIPSIEILRFPVRRQYLEKNIYRKILGLWDSMNSMSSWSTALLAPTQRIRWRLYSLRPPVSWKRKGAWWTSRRKYGLPVTIGESTCFPNKNGWSPFQDPYSN